MDFGDILGIIVLIVVIFLAFRIGAFLMKGLLGLVAIGIVIWLVASLLGGGEPVAAGPAAIASLAGWGAG